MPDEQPAPGWESQPPITPERIQVCEDNARGWTAELQVYADRMQRLADRWALTAGVLAAITSLSVWATLAETANGWAQALVAIIGVLSSFAALVPRIKNYAEEAGQARQLSTRYGRVYGKLVDARLWAEDHATDSVLRQVLEEFEDVKADKDQLRYIRYAGRSSQKRRRRLATEQPSQTETQPRPDGTG
ncbi:hypothetical protein AB0L64_13615 [Kribbella sp. NPDC051936]|uniref:hypothetical protein n=1 Tax=Kribbella sp. NPDC051936 TaxID=3154946 RepID=UPI00343D40E4